jgi:hypothetical protein
MTRKELLGLIDRATDEGWTALDLSGRSLIKFLPVVICPTTQVQAIESRWC